MLLDSEMVLLLATYTIIALAIYYQFRWCHMLRLTVDSSNNASLVVPTNTYF